jgi:hypothetical protein
MSSRLACRASPVGLDEKSSLNWMFSRLSLSRFMSYLPLLSFGPSAIVSGSAYLLPQRTHTADLATFLRGACRGSHHLLPMQSAVPVPQGFPCRCVRQSPAASVAMASRELDEGLQGPHPWYRGYPIRHRCRTGAGHRGEGARRRLAGASVGPPPVAPPDGRRGGTLLIRTLVAALYLPGP